MLTSKLQEISQYKAKIAALEKAVLSERQAQLLRVHTDLGFGTREELIKALRELDKPGAKKVAVKPKKAAAPAKKLRRKRAMITPELRANIEAAARTGATAAAVAKQFDVSIPTVQNIKRAAGLTRPPTETAQA